MITPRVIVLVLAFGCFLNAAFSVWTNPRVNVGWLGLALLTGALFFR